LFRISLETISGNRLGGAGIDAEFERLSAQIRRIAANANPQNQRIQVARA
jgi:hypothetical protein